MHIDHAGASVPRPTALRRPSPRARSAQGTIALLGLILVSACTSTQSQIQTGGKILPRPAVVVVHSFAVSPREVTLSEGLSSEVMGLVGQQNATPRSEQE